MDDPNIIMEEYVELKAEKACMRDFPAIVYKDALTSDHEISSEPKVCLVDDNEIDFKISFDESEDEDYTFIYDENSFYYILISVNNLKTNSENDNDEVNISSNDVVIELSDSGIDANADSQSHEFSESFKTKSTLSSNTTIRDMAPLPPRYQRHIWLRYEVQEYTDDVVHDYEICHVLRQRLVRCYLYVRIFRFKRTIIMGYSTRECRRASGYGPVRGGRPTRAGTPLSPAYVPDTMELDEHVPIYVPEPKHPEYHEPSDDDIQVEDQPYADDASPTAESPGYIADSNSMEEDTDADSIDYLDGLEDGEEDDDEDPEEDPSEEHEPEDDDDGGDTDNEDEEPTKDEEEEEHLAPADSSVVPVVDPVPLAGDT
ncbi:hypothetical protein Tco_1017932 [Tanacetum coccineum]|uniref:Uncharacterized protein n=1 Tax=Tanacetum coccineum TaxID=301880 RepID=A0ABQ5FSW1_9ASTR